MQYEWRILNINLLNFGIDSVARGMLSGDDLDRYDILQETQGNRPELFGEVSVGYGSDGSGESGIDYEVPAEALSDPEFAAMLEEAEKYLGTPYVWGGSSPETGFDCSGYVCWVLNQSGWDVGRTTANGLWQQAAKVSEHEAKPGDLVFFEGTYDTPGASHVGLYVGDGMMISAGDPIKYSNIHSSYWTNTCWDSAGFPSERKVHNERKTGQAAGRPGTGQGASHSAEQPHRAARTAYC